LVMVRQQDCRLTLPALPNLGKSNIRCFECPLDIQMLDLQ